jgi:hypothetical protein
MHAQQKRYKDAKRTIKIGDAIIEGDLIKI